MGGAVDDHCVNLTPIIHQFVAMTLVIQSVYSHMQVTIRHGAAGVGQHRVSDGHETGAELCCRNVGHGGNHASSRLQVNIVKSRL